MVAELNVFNFSVVPFDRSLHRSFFSRTSSCISFVHGIGFMVVGTKNLILQSLYGGTIEERTYRSNRLSYLYIIYVSISLGTFCRVYHSIDFIINGGMI